MPSPFPGMDPYLEDPYLWAGFHNELATEINHALNRDLPPPYWSQLEMRTEIGVTEWEPPRSAIADVSVHARSNEGHGRPARSAGNDAVAVLDQPRTEVSTQRRFRVSIEPFRVASVEVRDPRRGRELVTLIEILSPSNKRQGLDRHAYLQKGRRLLGGAASLIEIDLLRRGHRSWTDEAGIVDLDAVPQPFDYLIAVNRGWQRQPCFEFELFPVSLTERLPVIAVPLREGEPEIPLDLQYGFQLAYDGGPYWRGAVDYDQPPPTPLPVELEPWRIECVRGWRGTRAQ